MALSRLGDYITVIDIRNSDQKIKTVFGLNNKKEFMPTVATIDENSDISKYKLVEKGMFVFSGMQTGRDQNIRIGYSDYDFTFVISPAYTTFKVTNIIPTYFFMIFKSTEMDRYGAFLSDSSVRSNLDWDVFCNIELDIPPIDVQQKVVDVYLSMVANQKVYEKGLDDLKLTCDAYIEDLKHRNNLVELGNFLEEVTTQNSENRFKLKDVLGVSKNKEIIPTKANSSDNDLSKFTVIEKNDFVYNPRSANAIAINSSLSGGIISWNNTAFRVKKTSHFALLPKYLNLWFSRDEYSRWAKFNSWGSSTELLGLDEIKKYKIPIPELNIQEAIVKVYEAYEMRKKINENLKKHINEICPVLIKGGIDLN